MIAKLLLAILSFFLLGISAQVFIFRPKKIDLTVLGEIFGLGFGSAGLIMIIYSILGLKFSSPSFFILSFGLFIFCYLIYKPVMERIKLNKITFIESMLLVGIILYILLIVVKNFSFPIWGYDAYTIWLGRARAFFIDRAINKENLARFWPQEHPPLWSLVINWVYIFLGKPNELVIRFLPFLFYLLIIFSFYKNLLINKFFKYFGVFFLLTLPQMLDNVVDPHLAGNADLFLSFYFLLAIININKKEFSKAGLFLALASWVKSDATPAVLIFISLLIILKIKERMKPILFVSLPVLILFGAKYILGISSRYFKEIPQNLTFPYFWYDFMAFREEFRKISNWSLLWWLFFFVLVVKFKKIIKKKELLFGYLLIIGQIISYYLIFLITPENQAGHIASAIYRLLLHVAPAALFLSLNII